MISAALFQPFVEAYAAHAGFHLGRAELRSGLERRLGAMAPWARAAMAACAAWVRWLSPLMILGRARRFESLTEAEREELLTRLQRERRPAVRALFLGAKTVALGACYGRPEFLAGLGYGR